jgi:ssDNA-binding Zn-finger/Zn-ribbon topoisomerase 1
MARLNDDQDAAVDSTEILSPQPFILQNKGFLVSSLEPASESYQADNAQMSTQDYEYNSSSSSARHSTSDVFGQEMDDELEQLKSRASSRSSLSSVPASVLVHPVDKMKQMPDMDIHEKIAGYRIEQSEAGFGDFDEVPTAIRTIRQREAVFRKPSSVRAMQMHTEDEADDDDYLTPPRRRGGMRSPGSSPLKHSPYYSPNAPKPPKQKKEAPLVLLHCTLLPPSIAVPGAADPRNQDILEDELPVEYWKRWRRLQDRVGSGVVRDRGVLISHPEDLYDMLEERLLESLELQRPRLQNGHFVGRDDNATSDDELSDFEESETDGEQGDECPDCGGHVRHGDSNRKWEIRVFAANGLMRAGAWAAAWRDMEKVDVEVGLWLPSDVRRGLERRLAEEQMAVVERDQAQSPQMQMMHISSLVDAENQVLPEILQSPRQAHARMISGVGSFRSEGMSRQSFSEPPIQRDHHVPDVEQKREHEVALSTLFANYLRVLAADRRNIALVLLSVLAAFLAIGSRQQLSLSTDIHSFHGTSYDTTGPLEASRMTVASSPPSSLSMPILEYLTATEKVQAPLASSVAEVASSNDLNDIEAMSTDSAQFTEPTIQADILDTVHQEASEAPSRFVDIDIASQLAEEPEESEELEQSEESKQFEQLEDPLEVQEPFDSTAGFQPQLDDVAEPSESVDHFKSPDLSADSTGTTSSLEMEETVEPQLTGFEQEQDREEDKEKESI